MNWIKQNKFLASLAGSVVLLVAVAAFLGSQYGAEIKEAMAPRMKVLKTLKTMSAGAMENEDTIKAKVAVSKSLVGGLAAVVKEDAKWSKRHYNVPRFALAKEKGATRAAFPYNRQEWEDNGLPYAFVNYYHNELKKELVKMNPVILDKKELTEAIFADARSIQRKIDMENRVKAKEAKGELGSPAPIAGPGMPGANGAMDGEMPTVGGEMAPTVGEYAGFGASALRADTKTGYSKIALKEAVNNMRFKKANSGWIYADIFSLHRQYDIGVHPSTGESPLKLWNTMLSLWVQKDITFAVQKTIEEDFRQRKVAKAKQNVLTSAIKEIVSVHVGPVAKKNAPSGAYGGTESGMASEMAPVSQGNASGEATEGDALPRAATLTGARTNSAYEVVNYKFTLLMPTRQIPLVYKYLAERNYHVVLTHSIGLETLLADGTRFSVPGMETKNQSATGGFGLEEKGNARNSDIVRSKLVEQMRYYGTESLRLVTFEGEVKLLSSWTRGELSASKKKWISAPLMPLEVLRNLQRTNPAALRPTDQMRLEGTAPEYVATVYGRKPARKSRTRKKPAKNN